MNDQLITGGILLLCGVLIYFFPILIAGYNTMPKNKRKNVDIKGLKRYLSFTLSGLGVGFILLGFFMPTLLNEYSVGVVILLFISYILIGAQDYDQNPSKTKKFIARYKPWIYLFMAILLFCFVVAAQLWG